MKKEASATETLTEEEELNAPCGSCGKKIHLMICTSEDCFYLVSNPTLFCSKECLAEYERSLESYLEKA